MVRVKTDKAHAIVSVPRDNQDENTQIVAQQSVRSPVGPSSATTSAPCPSRDHGPGAVPVRCQIYAPSRSGFPAQRSARMS
jgi:hypothetical protein